MGTRESGEKEARKSIEQATKGERKDDQHPVTQDPIPKDISARNDEPRGY
ncbi:hypothetical protein M422DRAFT_38032 [Sphaerobolus stellatus SS14]|uniref:Unplaced genomic scaffold SPHSTscaffold_276, whole genome shotgun sequence n=1 Tax=Sphaerobolus stellatus (strain SS14) TaxID=990650 RepID=A0A0C9TYQ2_SPHS4|nr:hypothetical protein M422DRAFT_38032 [Sphaerobolus stellatus SS14]